MDKFSVTAANTLEIILEADSHARVIAHELVVELSA